MTRATRRSVSLRASGAEETESVHREPHGLIPNEIIAVSEDAVLQFLGKIHNPVDESEVTSAYRTILFTDLVGSTALAAGARVSGVPATDRRARPDHPTSPHRVKRTRDQAHRRRHHGVVRRRLANGLECALAIRSGFRARNETASTPLAVRIGRAAGEPVDRDGDLFGPTVNLASRLCAAADPDTILVCGRRTRIGFRKRLRLCRGCSTRAQGLAAPVHAYTFSGEASEDSEG